MHKRFLAGTAALALSVVAVGCSGADNTANTNANLTTNTNAMANMNTSSDMNTAAVRTASDGSEIRTETIGGVTTETRTFKTANGKVEKVVVTNRGGRRTARVYYRDNTVRELPDNAVESALVESADKLEDVGGKIVDVSKDVGSEIGDKAEDVGGAAVSGAKKAGSVTADKAEDVGGAVVSGAKKAGSVTADKAEDVGGAAASGAKKAGSATVKGAKKAGSAIKDAVTP